LLGQNLSFKVRRHPLEIGDHVLDLCNPSALLIDLKFLQAHERIT
jgi:hypothetical protein